MLTQERLQTAIRSMMPIQYKARSALGYFPGEMIGHIGLSEWLITYLPDETDAALTTTGFHPSTITPDPSTFGLDVYTVGQQMRLSESQLALFSRTGILPRGTEILARNVAKQASMYLWQGVPLHGATRSEAPQPGQYNYFYDAGSGNGTGARPIMAGDNATAGAWSTSTNMTSDLATLIGELIKVGSDLDDILVFYPRPAHVTMSKVVNTTTDRPPMGYLNLLGIPNDRIIPLDTEYLYTKAGANPTKDLFDLYAVDRTQVAIGYTRPETFRTWIPDSGRGANIDGEVWFCPLKIPIPFNDAGTQKIYCGVSRLTAIATS